MSGVLGFRTKPGNEETMHKYISVAVLAAALAGCAARRDGGKNVEVTWGLDTIGAAAADKQNVVLPILKCQLDGFVEDVSEYRAWAVKRKAPNGRIVATVPAAGTYYPAFIFYDGAGDERIAISIDGREAGTAVANLDDNRQKLFYLSTPQTFRGGEKIELRALTADGAYRTEDLLLLKAKPQAKQPVYAIGNVSAQAGPTSATVTWVTTWPAACTVETEGAAVSEPLALNNHRVALDKLSPGRSYRYRVAAQTREGRKLASEWQSFRTGEAAAPAGQAAKESLALKLEKGQLPVTAGVPFPKGMLGSDAQLRLLDSQSREIPLQTRVLERWPDGTVKWVLLDFQNQEPGVTLEFGNQVARNKADSPLQVTEDADAVTVDTGTLKFTVNKRRFGLLDAVWHEGGKVIDRPAVFTLTGPDGTVYTSAAAPEEVVVEENGPVRAVVRVSGRHQAADGKKLFTYTVRLHAWARQPYLRIQHTFGNDSGAADFTTIRSLALHLPLAGTGGEWSMAGRSGGFRENQPVQLKQHAGARYSVDPRIAQGRRASGWAERSGGGRVATLAVRDFWQNYPKDLGVSPEGFDVALCPALRQDEYDGANGTIDEHRLYYYLHGGGYKLRQGVTKTHDLWLEFGGKAAAAVRTEQQVRLAAAPAGWYARSNVFGELALPGAGGVLARYDQVFAQSFAGYLRDRETNREYGMLNFGDWWGERIINWGNSEYDTQHAFLLQFARTGDWRYFRAAEEMEWHNRDIDTIHYHSDRKLVGAVYAHAIGHTGAYYEQRPTAGAPPGGFREGSPQSHFADDHTFIEGHFDYYFLTGDRRSFETAIRTADRYDGYFTRNYDFNNCRQPGWLLVLTMAAYNATNDPYYLNAARIVVDRVLERQTPDGGWKRQMVPGHCFCTPRHQGNAGFMVGVLLTGLRHYYEATGDERAADSIVKGAHFLVNDMWVPAARGFRYTSCPKSSVGTWSNFLLFDGIVFAQRRTGDPQLRQVLLAGTDAALASMTNASQDEDGAWGKGFSQYTRVVPHFIDHLAKLQREARGGKGGE